MNTIINRIAGALSACAMVALITSCASQDKGTSTRSGFRETPDHRHRLVETETTETTTARTVAEPPREEPRRETTRVEVVEGGMFKTSTAFPTGVHASSAVLVERTGPVEVLVGQPFEVVYRISNLTDLKLTDVVFTTEVPSNFRGEESRPAATQQTEGQASWSLGELGPRESKEIIVRGAAREEGFVTACCTVTFVPVACDTIKVVKAAIQLVKSMPPEVTVCDPIPIRIVVSNTGSSALTDVRVTDTLPDGLTADGRQSVNFDAGTLRPGESKEFALTATASRTGAFENTARATTAQGITAEDSRSVKVTQPVLTITCESPEERFAGRPVDVCYTVKNTGDTVANDVVVEVQLPPGSSFRAATAGGQQSGNRVMFNVGALQPGATKELCLTAVGTDSGMLAFAATARATCAQPVSTTCQTKISGVPGILLEVIDTEDPIEVGRTTTYVIRVTNQGFAPITNVRVTAARDAESQEVESASGVTEFTRTAEGVQSAVLADLAPKATAEWRVVVKATKVENALFTVTMSSDQLREVQETESTNQY